MPHTPPAPTSPREADGQTANVADEPGNDEGDQDPECDYFALTDTLLREQAEQVLVDLAKFRSIAEKRLASPEASVAGSDIDQQFDEVFRVFLKETENLEDSIRDTMNREQARFHAIQFLLIVIPFDIFLFDFLV